MRAVLKPYSDYSSVELESIGEVPVGWDVLPFKRLCKRVDVGIAEAATHAYSETGVPIIRGTNIRPHRIEGEILYIEPWFAEKNRSKYMWAGDLVTVRTGYPGVTAVIPQALDKSQCFTMIISTIKKAHSPEFFCYFFNSVCGMAHFAVEGWGSAQTNISVPTVQRIEVPLPPPDEQRAIVAFLDREAAKIDRLMEVRRKQVERLQEQRTAVIHHAVTRGLDPNAKMKPSGVEWLGEVPEHWQIYRLKFTAKIKNGQDYKLVDSETGYPVIGSGGQFAFASTYMYDGQSVLFGRKGTIDKPLYMNGRFWTVDTMFYTQIKPILSAKFLYYCALGFPFAYYSTQTALPSMTQQDLGNHPIALPPKPEQRAIIAHIDRETSKLDTLAAKYRRELELLAEYRASLISHAVTGKIDVRGLVPTSAPERP